jgi:GNAT superfamily N-acetyltransferase
VTPPNKIALSVFELERFGVKTARATLETDDDLQDLRRFVVQHQIELVIARVDSRSIRLVQDLERSGALLMDCQVYYERDLIKRPFVDRADRSWVHEVLPGERAAVAEIAKTAFKGFFGHYHADARLDRDAADKAYEDWTVRLCSEDDVADKMFVASLDGQVAGFAAMRRAANNDAELILFASAPDFQGRGIFQALTDEALRWAVSIGAKRCWGPTHVANLGVQKVWVRSGFEPFKSQFTLHQWL